MADPDTPVASSPAGADTTGGDAALQALIPFRGTKDLVDNRYSIALSRPLPALNSKFAKAYVATDKQHPERELYALLCDVGMPYRQTAIENALNFEQPGMIRPIAAAITHISTQDACHYTMILERPRGRLLSDIIASGHRFSEKELGKDIIAPIAAILREFASAGFAHGKINADTIYFDETATPKVQVGECFSEPCGFSQSYYYETIHRSMATPIAKGETDTSADYFALGRLVLYLVFGSNPNTGIEEEVYLKERVRVGSYNLMVGDRELSGMTADFVKGLLNDDRRERWGSEQIEIWLGGKRFNLLSPAIPKEAPRPIAMFNTQFFNRMSLAHALHQNWEEAAEMLRDDKVFRWVELSIGDNNTAEAMKKIISYTGGDAARMPTDDDSLISKFILLLDPDGPIRTQGVSVYPDGLGPLLAEYYRENRQKNLPLIEFMLAEELPSFWKSLHKNDTGVMHDAARIALQLIEQQRKYSRVKGPGFGIERMLYDFNPTLPCLSPLVDKYHAQTMESLLYALEDLSHSPQSRSKDPLDTHLAAFLANRMEIKSVVRSEMEAFPHLKNNMILKAITLLAPAQRKIGNPPLKGLTRWIANRLAPVVETFHGKALRENVQKELKDRAETGILVSIVATVSNVRMVSQDDLSFKHAAREYYKNTLALEKLRDQRALRFNAKRFGMRLSLTISYGVLAVTLLSLVNSYISLMK